jgi:hypothetical protein
MKTDEVDEEGAVHQRDVALKRIVALFGQRSIPLSAIRRACVELRFDISSSQHRNTMRDKR